MGLNARALTLGTLPLAGCKFITYFYALGKFWAANSNLLVVSFTQVALVATS